MHSIINIHRPGAKKTAKLNDVQSMNKFKENAIAAKSYEDYAEELLKLSGNVKRMCKELHGIVEQATKAPTNEKKEKYANKINAKLEQLNTIIDKWDKKIEEGQEGNLEAYYTTIKSVTAQDLGAT